MKPLEPDPEDGNLAVEKLFEPDRLVKALGQIEIL